MMMKLRLGFLSGQKKDEVLKSPNVMQLLWLHLFKMCPISLFVFSNDLYETCVCCVQTMTLANFIIQFCYPRLSVQLTFRFVAGILASKYSQFI